MPNIGRSSFVFAIWS